MHARGFSDKLVLSMFAVWCLVTPSTVAAETIAGRVLGGGSPIAGSTVTLWEGSADAPKQLVHASTDSNGRFEVRGGPAAQGAVLYLIASGGRPSTPR